MGNTFGGKSGEDEAAAMTVASAASSSSTTEEESPALSNEMISAVMSQEGPVVKVCRHVGI